MLRDSYDRGPIMIKFSDIINYGNPMHGKSYFDTDSNIKIIKDKGTGDDTVSLFVTGVNSVVAPDGKSSSPAHKGLIERHGDYISELVSNSLSKDKKALKAFIERYVRTLKEYKAKHGVYPKQRIIGHSRGGAGAIEIADALQKEHPDLPQFDDFVNLDGYDLPFYGKKNTIRKDKKRLSRRSFIIRPKRPGFFHSDASDMNRDGKITRKERIYGKFANLLVKFGKRVNPYSKYRSYDIAVPGIHHSSSLEMLDTYFKLKDVKNKYELRKKLRDLYKEEDSALISGKGSPMYGDTRLPFYTDTYA